MISKFYKVECITNLHMGSGEINFSIVDNEVERDPLTGYPSMYSSGLKGALRTHFEKMTGKGSDDVNLIFGKESDGAGQMKFLTGNILFQAVRASAGKEVYYLVTCKDILEKYADMLSKLSNDPELKQEIEQLNPEVSYRLPDKNGSTEKAGVEQFVYEQPAVINKTSRLGVLFASLGSGKKTDQMIIIPNNDMKAINLPVIARNQLDDNGISKQLWYEEIVPHESIFYFAVVTEDENIFQKFDDRIKTDPVVQFGGNASIGYGLTYVSGI